MRLRVKTKQKLTKTDKQKRANIEKKSKGPKLSKDYFNMDPFKLDRGTVDLTKLRYGMIESCDLLSVTTMEGVIELKGSWLELVMTMMATVIDGKPDEFMRDFTNYEVTNQTFLVDKIYGKYTFDSKEQYKVYNIYNTGYYLEAIINSKNIFSAIVGLCKIIGITFDNIQFNIQKIGINEVKLNFDSLEETESIVNINGVTDKLKVGIHLVGIQILNVNTIVHRMDMALLVFCNWVYDTYGEDTLSKLISNSSTGIQQKGNNENIEEFMYQTIKNSSIQVYTNGDTDGIIKFIRDNIQQTGLNTEQVRFKFRALKQKAELKEWEVE
jgi:hypothetical protein